MNGRTSLFSGKRIVLSVVAAMWPISTVAAAQNMLVTTMPSPATTQPSDQNASSLAATRPAATQASSHSHKKNVEAAKAPSPAADLTDDLNSMGLEDLMHVKVNSVSKIDQNISQAAAAITVISQDDIHRSGFTNIPELLRLAPGLEVARTGASSWAIGSRGFNSSDSDKLLVVMDGRTVYDPLYAGVAWNMQDYLMADLDRVEVIRGPGATLWGSNAVNGVINITTKSAKDTQGGILDLVGGTFDSTATMRYGGKIGDNTYYRVYGKFDNTMDLTDNPLRNSLGNWEGTNGGFRIDKYPDADTVLTLQGSTQYNLTSPSLDSTDVNRLLPSRHDVSNGSNLLGRWTHSDSPESGLSLQIYYDHVATDLLQDYNYHRDTVDLDFQHHFQLQSSQEITWGFGLRAQQEASETSHPISFRNGTRDDYIASNFVQDDLTLVPKHFHLILGSKFEYSSYDKFQVQPSARLLFTPNEYNTFWVAASRAVRSPSIVELAGKLQIGEAAIRGNSNFKPEIVKAYEFGYRTQPTDKLTLDLATFYNKYSQLGALDASSVMQTGSLETDNASHGDSYGVEIAANYKVNPSWRLAASYTFFMSHLSLAPGSVTSPGDDASTSPKNQFQLHSYYDLTRDLELNISGYYVDSMAGVNSYPRLDMGLTWRPAKGMEFGIEGQNLLQSHHAEFFQQGFTQSEEIPRSFLLRFTYSF